MAMVSYDGDDVAEGDDEDDVPDEFTFSLLQLQHAGCQFHVHAISTFQLLFIEFSHILCMPRKLHKLCCLHIKYKTKGKLTTGRHNQP